MASADAMEREAERRRLAFLAAARAAGFNPAPAGTPVNVPQMTEAAGPIITPEPEGGWKANLGNLGGMLKDMGLSLVPGTEQSYQLANVVQNDPLSIPVGAVKSVVNTVSNVADLAPVIDTGEPGVNYINAWNRGEGLSMGAEDLLNLIALSKVAKAGMAGVRTNVTNPGARFNPYEYGIHVNVPGEAGNISKIIPRKPGQATVTGGDSLPGTSYMWDATSPGIVEGIMRNPQMTNSGMLDVLYDNPPAAYFTRAPRARTGTDINIPTSPSLSVQGSQKVLEQVPLTEQALKELLTRRRVMQMTEDAGVRKIFANSAKVGIPDAIGDNNAIMAYNFLRDRIIRAQGEPNNPLSKYDPNITIGEMVNDPELFPQMDSIAASRIMGQQRNPDLIRDQILTLFNENEYRLIVQEAQRLNDAGIPFEQAMSEALDRAAKTKYGE